MTLKIWSRIVLVALSSAVCVRFAPAEEPPRAASAIFPLHLMTYPESPFRGCCDYYCPKVRPCIAPRCFGCGDCYCGKPRPGVACFSAGCGCIDYCRKPGPDLCRPIAADFYMCAEAAPARRP
jgi:hypothetical protein